MSNIWNWTAPVKCFHCGKEFYRQSQNEWAYKMNERIKKGEYRVRLFCSWKCMREFETEHENGKAAIRHRREIPHDR